MPYYSAEVLADLGAGIYTKLDELSGAAIHDPLAGAAAVISGAYTLGEPGPMPNARAIRLSYGRINFGNVDPLGDGPFSFEMLFKPATIGGWLLGKTDATFGIPGYAIELRPGATNTVRLQDGSTSTHINNTGQVLLPADWNHAVFTRALATNAKLYVAGVPVAISASAKTFSNNLLALILGEMYDSSGLGFDGWLSRFALYPSELSAPRVAAHYAAIATGEDPYHRQLGAALYTDDGEVYYYRTGGVGWNFAALDQVDPGAIGGIVDFAGRNVGNWVDWGVQGPTGLALHTRNTGYGAQAYVSVQEIDGQLGNAATVIGTLAAATPCGTDFLISVPPGLHWYRMAEALSPVDGGVWGFGYNGFTVDVPVGAAFPPRYW